MPGDDETKPEVTVESVSAPRLNPPSMTEANIDAYFMSLEFWFEASGITSKNDSRKYNIVMAQVPPNKLNELRSIIDAVPNADKYTYIKKKLIEYFADSQQRRLQRVLSDMPLGDMKPSLLFSEMKRVAGESLSEAVLLDLWGTRLPTYAQAAVIAATGDAANKIAIADAIVESMGLRNINAIAVDSSHVMAGSSGAGGPTANSIAAMQGEIAELTRKLDAVLRNGDTRSSSRSRSRTRRNYERRGRETSSGPCWYHRTYGNDAQRCRKPCTFGQSSSANHQ